MRYNKLKDRVLILLACILITSCAGNKQGGGTAVGTIAGGLIGAQMSNGSPLGAIVGAVAGGFAGSAIGRHLDERDRMIAIRTTQYTLETAPSGKVVAWNNPDTRNHGTVTATKTYQTERGEYCREYNQTVSIGGEIKKAYGTACRKPDGQWQIIN